MPRTKKPFPAKKKPRLTDRERGRIEGLHEACVSACDIALVTERSRDTVARVLRPEHEDAQALRQLSQTEGRASSCAKQAWGALDGKAQGRASALHLGAHHPAHPCKGGLVGVHQDGEHVAPKARRHVGSAGVGQRHTGAKRRWGRLGLHHLF
ncbi:hypothetical protein PC116_g15000 [Phytophthora cactorum]|nr:hypothetical protein PC116_g15000 [Phytophthora cactorum]